MQKLRSTEVKIIGAFFLVAGLYGLFTFLGLVFPLDSFLSFLNIFPTVLFGLTLYSGYLLLIKENEKGIEIGRAVIALQIIQFQIGGLTYSFITGAFVFAGFINLNFGLNFGLQNTFIVNLSDEAPNTIFRVNILALAILIYLTRLMKKIEQEREMEEVLNQELNNK